MAKPIITLNGLKMVIMLGMLVIILTGIRFAADIIVPFIPGAFSGGDHQSSGPAPGPLPGAARAGDLATDWPDCYVSHCAAGLAGDLAQRAGAHPAAVSQLSL